MCHTMRSPLKKNIHSPVSRKVYTTSAVSSNHLFDHSEAFVNFIKMRKYLPISCQVSFLPDSVLSCNLKEKNFIRLLDSICNMKGPVYYTCQEFRPSEKDGPNSCPFLSTLPPVFGQRLAVSATLALPWLGKASLLPSSSRIDQQMTFT